MAGVAGDLVGGAEPLVFKQTEHGMVRLSDAFPSTIEVSGVFLDAVTRGQMADGAVSVSGHVETIEGLPTLPVMVWDSITFVCVNGAATYEIVEQNADDHMRDQWRGVRRDIADNAMAGLD